MEIDEAEPQSRPSEPLERSSPESDTTSPEKDTGVTGNEENAPNEEQEEGAEPNSEEEEEIESEEEANEDNNVYLRLIKSSVEAESKSDFKSVLSPVVAPHMGSIPPFSSLSVYETIVSDTLPLLSSITTLRTSSSRLRQKRTGFRTRRTPFLEEHSMSLWQPLEVPVPLLIDLTPPQMTNEWQTLQETPPCPQVTTIIDAENMLTSPLVVHWASVNVLPRGRKYAKRTVASQLTTVSSMSAPSEPVKEEEEPARETPASKIFPRAAKKRTRDSVLPSAQDDELSDQMDRKRRHDEPRTKHEDSSKDFILRLNIAAHLSFEQTVINNALRASASSAEPPFVKSEDRDAAELLELFRSSDAIPPSLSARQQPLNASS